MNAMSSKVERYLAITGQFVLYAVFAGAIALFSGWPVHHPIGDDQALIILSIVHEGQRLKVCAQRTPEELARLPPNMRAPLDCPRERAPLAAEVELDGQLVAHQVAQPSGLSRDGRASLYQRLVTTAGSHRIVVRLRDRAGEQGFDYQREATIQLQPAQVLVIDFEPTRREITFR